MTCKSSFSVPLLVLTLLLTLCSNIAPIHGDEEVITGDVKSTNTWQACKYDDVVTVYTKCDADVSLVVMI